MATVSTQTTSGTLAQWTAADAADVYHLSEWGKGYFQVGESGHVIVHPRRDESQQIDLFELVEGLNHRDICSPVLIRFSDILHDRMLSIRDAFGDAISENEYQGSYRCVYPIKVNQQRNVCEEIRDLGSALGFGLEAGSKPELLAVLALTADKPDMPIVCNGFKDSEFVETVILAAKLGRNIIPVVERLSDLKLIVEHAQHYGVRPRIGIRIKPSVRGAGRWESSSGMRSKFGLSASEVLGALEYLKACGMADCLRMLHFHIGSQICDIRQLKTVMHELAYVYVELIRLGAGLDTIDIGGGLGVDYDGTQTANESSINYTLAEYAADVVYPLKAVCDDAGVAHPDIISESGRAMVAYSSVLVFDVVGRTVFPSDPDMEAIKRAIEAEKEPPHPVLDLVDAYERLEGGNLVEIYHDAVQARDEAMSLFGLGYLSLPMRAATERLFWAIGRVILQRNPEPGQLHEDLQDLPEILSDLYYCNFSLFQSMPDSWAIDHVFPVCPIHRLNERPTRRAMLADITCDSDGKIDRFVGSREHRKTLELHELIEDEPYYLGVFLVGAYQEVLGDLHNLFGDTHAVHISVDDDGGWSIDEFIEGDSVKEVLGYVQFDTEQFRRTMRRDVERAVKRGSMDVSEGQLLFKF